MGGDIVPMLTTQKQAEVYDFRDNDVPGVEERERGYWRDVGTLDAYYDAHQDLISVNPTFSLYNRDWPILTNPGVLPPAKVVNGGSVPDSLISHGVIVSGSQVHQSVLSPGVRVHDGSWVEGSVLAHGVVIGHGAVVRRAILDKNVVIGPGSGSASTASRISPAARRSRRAASPCTARASGSSMPLRTAT